MEIRDTERVVSESNLVVIMYAMGKSACIKILCLFTDLCIYPLFILERFFFFPVQMLAPVTLLFETVLSEILNIKLSLVERVSFFFISRRVSHFFFFKDSLYFYLFFCFRHFFLTHYSKREPTKMNSCQ